MPVLHQYTIKAGTRAKLLLLYASDGSATGAGKTGLRHDTPEGAAAYVREGEAVAHPVRLVRGAPGAWSSGGWTEVDRESMPGVYQLGAPDGLLAKGSARALFLVRFPGAVIKPVEVNLVAFDPQDAERIGVSSLANRERHEFLRRALPRLTEMELALGEEAERELSSKLQT